MYLTEVIALEPNSKGKLPPYPTLFDQMWFYVALESSVVILIRPCTGSGTWTNQVYRDSETIYVLIHVGAARIRNQY